MFGSDLPSMRAKRPFYKADNTLIHNLFEASAVEKILYQNALQWYRL